MENSNAGVDNIPTNQNQFANQIPPPQQLPQPTQPPLVPKPSKKRVVFIIIGLLLIAATAIAILLWKSFTGIAFLGWQAPEMPQLSSEQIGELEKKYGYEVTYRPDLSPNEKFNFTTEYDYSACERDTCSDAFAVYSSADLTKKVASFITTVPDGTNRTVSIAPPVYDKAIDSSKIGANGYVEVTYDTDTNGEIGLPIMNKNRWGVAEMYYLVQRLDENGDQLAKPKVTIFTVKPDTKVLQATDVTADVDTNGAVNFSWSSVENAKEYYVVMIQRGKADNYVGKYTVIARTAKTSLNLADYNGDKSRAEKALSTTDIFSDEGTTFTQNHQLSYFDIKDEDDFFNKDGSTTLPSGSYVPTDNGAVSTSFAIIAVNGDSYSPAREIDGNALLASTPVNLAFNQSSFMSNQNSSTGPYNYDRLPKTQPMTMADGHTAKKAVIFNADRASVNTSLPTADELMLPYVVQGTYIAGSEMVYGTKGSFTKDYIKSKVEELNKRNLAAQPPGGAIDLPYVVKSSENDLQLTSKNTKTSDTQQTTQKTSSTNTDIPSVDYPVNGSTPLVRYIAANILAGNYTMDIANYYTDPTVGIWDALWEAVYQNPYIGVNSAYLKNVQLKGTILSMQFSGISQSEVTSRQNELYNRVKSIVPTITNSGMSDREKALAINKWLSENASYDDAAFAVLKKGWSSGDYSEYYTNFPYAWNGLGTAAHNKGVCVSYADAFKAFADQAGLKAAVVIGTDNVSGGKHAWNKAFFDGKWQVIDVTWNDAAGGSFTKYFGLTDAAANRVQDNNFMVDRFIGDYVAN